MLFPAGGYVAEVGVEQVVGSHSGEPGIHDPALANADLVDGSLHIVVDAAPGNAAEGPEGTSVGVEEHFMALCRVGGNQKGLARAELGVGCQYFPDLAADHEGFFAPVELEGFARRELQGNEGGFGGAACFSPVADVLGDAAIAAAVAECL